MRRYTDQRLAEGIVKLHNLMSGQPQGVRIDEITTLEDLYSRAEQIMKAAEGIMNRVGQIENGL